MHQAPRNFCTETAQACRGQERSREQSQGRVELCFPSLYSDKIPKRISHWPQGVNTRDLGTSPRAAGGLWGLGGEDINLPGPSQLVLGP